jgi:hypothetical protein
VHTIDNDQAKHCNNANTPSSKNFTKEKQHVGCVLTFKAGTDKINKVHAKERETKYYFEVPTN